MRCGLSRARGFWRARRCPRYVRGMHWGHCLAQPCVGLACASEAQALAQALTASVRVVRVGCLGVADALKRTGNEKFMAKEFAEAVELYTQALKHDPTNKLLLGNRSAARRQLKDFNGALEDATAAVKAAPDWPKVRVCAARMGKREDRAACRAGLRPCPHVAPLHLGLVRVW